MSYEIESAITDKEILLDYLETTKVLIEELRDSLLAKKIQQIEIDENHYLRDWEISGCVHTLMKIKDVFENEKYESLLDEISIEGQN